MNAVIQWALSALPLQSLVSAVGSLLQKKLLSGVDPNTLLVIRTTLLTLIDAAFKDGSGLSDVQRAGLVAMKQAQIAVQFDVPLSTATKAE